MEIALTPEIKNAVEKEARRQGTTPELVIIGCLRAQFVPASPNEKEASEQGTLADFLTGHIGVLASSEHVAGGARMSEDTGKKFAEGLLQKRRQGRL